ncbi:MAG: alpha/beta hydrolase [Flavobacteriaceae bacterium]|nr:alpha/beta hydrolase [Flavobacteriaceae bacterium]
MIRILIITFGVVLILFTIGSCLNFRTSDSRFLKDFSKVSIGIKVTYHSYKDKKMRLVHSYPMDTTKPTLFYIHGSPGSNDNFKKLMKDPDIQSIANWVSVDRLGYGYSELGKAEVSISEQSKSLLTVCEPYFKQSSAVILIGWSYGGPIASKMALDNSLQIDHVIMLAPQIDPDVEKFFFIGNFAKWKLTRWMVPRPLRVAQDEKMAHVDELVQIQDNWKNLKVPVTNVHGNKDDIVPYENLDFVSKNFPKETTNLITLEGVGHLFPISKPEITKQIILKVLVELNDFEPQS